MVHRDSLPRMTTKAAVILAAGVGSRLRPLTDDRPKALVSIGAETILERAVRLPAEHGVERLVIASGYREDAIVGALGNCPLEVTYCHNPRVRSHAELGVARALSASARRVELLQAGRGRGFPPRGAVATRCLARAARGSGGCRQEARRGSHESRRPPGDDPRFRQGAFAQRERGGNHRHRAHRRICVEKRCSMRWIEPARGAGPTSITRTSTPSSSPKTPSRPRSSTSTICPGPRSTTIRTSSGARALIATGA